MKISVFNRKTPYIFAYILIFCCLSVTFANQQITKTDFLTTTAPNTGETTSYASPYVGQDIFQNISISNNFLNDKVATYGFFPWVGKLLLAGEYNSNALLDTGVRGELNNAIYVVSNFGIFSYFSYTGANTKASLLSLGLFSRIELIPELIVGLNTLYDVEFMGIQPLNRLTFGLDSLIPFGFLYVNYYKTFFDLTWTDPEKLIKITWNTPLFDMGFGFRWNEYFRLGPTISVNQGNTGDISYGALVDVGYPINHFRPFVHVVYLSAAQGYPQTKVSIGFSYNLSNDPQVNKNLFYPSYRNNHVLFGFPSIQITDKGASYLQPSLQSMDREVVDKLFEEQYKSGLENISDLKDSAINKVQLTKLQE